MESIKNNKGHKRFACLMGALLLLIMVRYAFQIDIPRILFLVIIGMIAIFGDRNEIVASFLCFIPMHESIDFYYAIVICCAIYIFKYYKSLSFGWNLVLVLIIAIWELLHCFLTSFDVVIYLSYIVPFVLLAIIMASDLKNLDYAFVVRSFAYCVAAITLILIVRVVYFADFNFVVAFAKLQRLGSDYHSSIGEVAIQGGQINPNSLGIIAVLASTGLMQLRSLKVGKKSDMVLMCIILAVSALSASRTYLACLAMMVVLFVFSEKGGLVNKLRMLGLLTAAIGVATAAMAIFFPDTFEYFVGRFNVEDITTGRDDLMTAYHQFIVNNPKILLFGVGLQDFGNRLIYHFNVAVNAPHNSLQEIIVAWGIPGLLLFLGLFLSMFQVASAKNKNIRLINWIPLIIILFKSVAGQMLTSGYTMVALTFAYLSLCQNFFSVNKSSL